MDQESICEMKNVLPCAEARIVLVIPAYNEAAFIEKAVDAARLYLSAMTEHWIVVVVEDGSTDGTPVILSEISSKDRHASPT